MAFKIESPAEAYAAVSLLVAGADGVGTLKEREFLLERLREAEVFSGQDAESLGGLLGSLTGRMFSDLPNDGVALDVEAISSVCAAAKGVLSGPQREELFSLAVELACCDGLENVERAVLVQIATELGIDAGAAESAIARASR